MQPDIPGKEYSLHKDFQRLFLLKEGKALMGHRYRNAWILASILFVTFCAIGFANGSLEYLSRKMDDPFINWVNIAVPFNRLDSIAEIEEALNEEPIRTAYSYKHVSGNFRFPLRFPQVGRRGTFSVTGRTLETGNPLLDNILESDNLLYGTGFSGERERRFDCNRFFSQGIWVS